MQLIYNDKDIFNDVSINQCWHEMSADKKADSLTVRFNNADNLWDSWNPKTGDKIQVKSGVADSGVMFIDSVMPKEGLMTLTAYSFPPTAKDIKSKSWNDIKFSALAQYVADNNGLSLEMYKVEDNTYKYVAQKNVSDFAFLAQRAALEGCSFLVYNEKLIVYSEKEMEGGSSQGTIEIDKGVEMRPDLITRFEYADDRINSYEEATITNGLIKGAYSCGNGTGKKLHIPIALPMTDDGEAERFARNILRSYNKNSQTGVLTCKFLDKYSPGSVVTLKNEEAASWNCDVFITKVRHDYTHGKTRIEFRKKLEGY